MENLIVNETPIRTSKNYEINHIKLENIEMPKEISNFDGMQIIGDVEQFAIRADNIENEIKYGNGEILEEQIKKNANKNIQIKVQDDSKKEMELDFCFSEENKELIDNILIQVEEQAEGTIILKYEAKDNLKYYHNGQVKLMAKKDSKVNVIILNLLNNQSHHFLAVENIVEEQADVKYTVIDLGGKNSITNYYTNLKGEKSNNKIQTIYLGNEIKS